LTDDRTAKRIQYQMVATKSRTVYALNFSYAQFLFFAVVPEYLNSETLKYYRAGTSRFKLTVHIHCSTSIKPKKYLRRIQRR
jgi:hypothetical protein